MARSLSEHLAILDDDDANARVLLVCALSIAGLLACRGVASDDDESVANLGLLHDNPCSGDGQQWLMCCSVRTAIFYVKASTPPLVRAAPATRLPSPIRCLQALVRTPRPGHHGPDFLVASGISAAFASVIWHDGESVDRGSFLQD